MLRKTLKLRLALIFGSLVFALVMAEFGLRMVGAYSPASLHLSPPNAAMRDVETNWDITYYSNSQGLRDEEYSAAKPAGTIRVVVIGDSFTFGQGCQRGEIFPDVLEARLNAAGHHAQVINVSHVGIGPESYFVLLQSVALKYRPDVVVLNTFGNDASEVRQSPLPNRMVKSLSHSSPLFVLLRALRYRTSAQAQGDFWTTVEAQAKDKSAAGATRLANFRKEHGSAPNNLVAALVSDPEEVARWIDTPVDGAGWSQFQDYVGAMASICRTHGIKFVIGIIPDGAQVDPHQLSMRQKFGVPLRDGVLTESGNFQQLVHEYATAKGIMCFDPLAKFRAVGAGLYFDSDLHWSPAGHKLYADLLADYLEAQVL